MGFSALSRLVRPRTFLYLMTLRTGTELITLITLINKVTGVYGILAIFTGYHLSPLQLSMYIYSIIVLIATAILTPHIRKQSPFQCLVLAWLFLLDSIVNIIYTVAFSVSWFLVLAVHTAPLQGADRQIKGPGAATINQTAGFTNPQYDATHVEVTGASPDGLVAHVTDDIVGGGGVLQNTILQSGSIASVLVIGFLWALRIYYMLIVLAYARGVLRQSIVASAVARGTAPTSKKMADDEDDVLVDDPLVTPSLENPFRDMPGWRGAIGRAMVAFPSSYWLGPDNEGDTRWMRQVGRKLDDKQASGGLVERERRRRAGTGPPLLKPLEMNYLKR